MVIENGVLQRDNRSHKINWKNKITGQPPFEHVDKNKEEPQCQHQIFNKCMRNI